MRCTTGQGQGAILIAASGEVAAPAQSVPGRGARPVRRGEFISIFCIGLGPVTNPPASGAAALASPPSVALTLPEVTIGGLPTMASFAGLAPFFVGLGQVNVRVPENVPGGNNVPVTLTVDGVASNVVTIAVE